METEAVRQAMEKIVADSEVTDGRLCRAGLRVRYKITELRYAPIVRCAAAWHLDGELSVRNAERGDLLHHGK